MDFNGHVTTGVITSSVAAGATAYFINPYISGHVFVASMIFSLYPDMDTGSISRRLLVLAFSIAMIILYTEGYIESSLGVLSLIIIPSLFKHRGFTHSFFGMLFFVGIYYTSVVYCIGFEEIWPIAVGGIVGYSTHLLSDL